MIFEIRLKNSFLKGFMKDVIHLILFLLQKKEKWNLFLFIKKLDSLKIIRSLIRELFIIEYIIEFIIYIL